jgi:radical SAM-linked protein
MHPRIRLNIAQALPLGCSSDGELMDVWLTEERQVSALQEAIAQALPDGLAIEEIQSVKLTGPKLQKLIHSAEYVVGLPHGTRMDALGDRVDKILAAKSIVRTRRGKSYDLRPLVISLTLDSASEHLTMQLSSLDGATGRADEVLRELEVDPADTRIHRKRLVLSG